MYKEIFTILISVTSITGLILWFIKEYLKKILDSDSERFKNKLALENQKYSKLQNEQFEALKSIYSNLIKTEELINEFYHIVKDDMEFSRQHKERIAEPLTKLIFQTQTHFKENRIFIPKSLVSEIDKVIEALFFCLTKSTFALIVRSEDFFDDNGKNLGIITKNLKDISNEDKKEFEEIIKLIEKTKNEELPKLIEDIETEFRKIFGSK